MLGNWLSSILLPLTLILCGLFGCGSSDVTAPDNGNSVPTITIEKIRVEKVEVVEKIESGVPTIVNEVHVGFHSEIIATYAEKISWRLNAAPAPSTDLVVRVNIGYTDLHRYLPGANPKDYHWVVIPKFQTQSQAFEDTVHAGVIKVHPLPMIFVDGEGLVIDSEKLERELPNQIREAYKIEGHFDFSAYTVGDPSEILCERCGEIIEIIIPESTVDHVDSFPATTVKVNPSPGTMIPANQQFGLYLDEPVTEVRINGTTGWTPERFHSGEASFWLVSPTLAEGPEVLNIEWTNRNGTTGSQRIGPYRVYAPDAIAPLIIRGTLTDGMTDVNSGLVNASGLQYDFDERVTGSIKLTDEVGADLNWLGSVAGRTATLVPIAGMDLGKGTIYKIEIDVRDASSNRTRKTITFVTEIK